MVGKVFPDLLFTHSLPIRSLVIGRATVFCGVCKTVAIGSAPPLESTVLYRYARPVNSTEIVLTRPLLLYSGHEHGTDHRVRRSFSASRVGPAGHRRGLGNQRRHSTPAHLHRTGMETT